MDAEQQELREYQREYLDFLDDNVSYLTIVYCVSPVHSPARPPALTQEDQGIYQEKVREMVRAHSHRLIVNINELRRKNAKRAAKLLNESQLEMLSFQVCPSPSLPLDSAECFLCHPQRALREFVLSVDDAYGKQFEEFYVGFEGRYVHVV